MTGRSFPNKPVPRHRCGSDLTTIFFVGHTEVECVCGTRWELVNVAKPGNPVVMRYVVTLEK